MQCGRHIWLGAYVISEKGMYNSTCGDIDDFIELIWGMYIVVSYVHMNLLAI